MYTIKRAGVAITLMGLLMSCGSSEEPVSSTSSSTSTGSQTGSVAGSADASRYEMTLSETSWGRLPEAAPPPPHPTIVSEREGRRQKFQREAVRRLKNLEIFVMRSH